MWAFVWCSRFWVGATAAILRIPSQPVYGTHDWVAQHALDWLPAQEKGWLVDNLAAYLYGTELPDNNQAPDHIGDTVKHHIYYRASGALEDDAAAVRASTEFAVALNFLNQQDYANAAKAAGIMSHYISDVAVFAHVMGSGTDWGAETGNNHSNYESYVLGRTSNYDDEFNRYLSFDGALTQISAATAAENLANDTTFDHGDFYTCTWMNNNYNVNNPTYWNRAGQSLNLAVNTITDTLHTLYLASNLAASPTATPTTAPTPTLMPTQSPTTSPTATTIPTSAPTITPTSIPTQTPTPTLAPTQAPTQTTTPTATTPPTQQPSPTQTIQLDPTPLTTPILAASPTVPELPTWTLPALALTVVLLTLMVKRKH